MGKVVKLEAAGAERPAGARWDRERVGRPEAEVDG